MLADRLYRGLGEADSGLAVLQAHLVRNPDDALAQLGIGQALLHMSAPEAAEIHLKHALSLDSNNQEAYKTLGKALSKQNRYAEALLLYEECQKRWPSETTLAQLAVGYYHACDYRKSLDLLETLEAQSLIDNFGLQSFFAQTLLYAGHTTKALQIMDREMERLGRPPHLCATRSFTHLLMGEFGPGWDGYRFRQLGLNAFRVLPVPQWQGETLDGKTIVVLAEQGLGDQIMFASCVPDLIALKPARLVIEAIDRVAATLARSFPTCEVIASKQDKQLKWLRDLGDVHFFIPITDLAGHFRRNIESFPRVAYLQPAPERVRYWRARLERLGPGPYIGTSWRGGTEQTRTAIRTLSPNLLAPLTNAIPSQWISLQYGNVQEDLQTAAGAGVHLTHWPEAIADLDEFAALVSALDGVFTVCNTTVHYAGAVGQYVWVLAPMVPEWRYGLTSTHMPWYPNVQVLRQPSLNAWAEVIEEARLRLIDKFSPLTEDTSDNFLQ
jgi:tetratricopeptide (TPR) repeat protein